MGMLPKAVSMSMKKRGEPKSPYEDDMTEETDLTEQAAAPATGNPIEIGNDNDNDGWSQDQQECENDPDDQELFSAESDDNNDENDPDDDYSQSSDGVDKKKRSKRKNPTSTIRTPRNTHW